MNVNGRPVLVTINGIRTWNAGGDINIGANELQTTSLYLKEHDTSTMKLCRHSDDVTMYLTCGGVQFRVSNYATADAAWIGANAANDDYLYFAAYDNDNARVEIGRISGAAEPWFGIGKDSDVVKATYDDKLGFFSTTPVAKPLKANFNNWAAATDVAGALAALGLVDSA